jgi:OMF family outer membrane factor
MTRNFALTLVLVSVTTTAAPVAAQVKFGVPGVGPVVPTVRRLSLEEARQLALANNPALTLARLNVAEKQYGITAARKDYLPKLMGNVTYFHFNDNLGNIAVTAPGTRGILPPGTPLASTAILNENSTFSTLFLAQPITKLIAVNAAVQAARADAGAAQAQLDKGTRDLLSGITQAYEGLLGAQRILAAVELQVKMLEELVKVKPVPQLRIGLVEARQGLVQVRGQVRELTETLNNLLDLPACTELELVDPLPPELPLGCPDDAANLAVARSPEVREAEENIGKAEAFLKLAKMDYLPDVNVVGGYANQTFANYIQPNFGYVGVTANYTFFGWGKRGDVKRQRETLVALAQQNVVVTRNKVALEARKAYLAYAQARESLGLAREMAEARKDAERAAQGAAVLQAKADTAKAELELMKADIAYRVAHAQLAAVIGH